MGAYATWDLLVHAPAMFAVSIPSSGGGDTKLAARITGRLGLGLYRVRVRGAWAIYPNPNPSPNPNPNQLVCGLSTAALIG